MAGPIQGAMSGALSAGAGAAIAAKKIHEDEKQAAIQKAAASEAEKKAKEAISEEAKETALEADLIRMGADPKRVSAFMDARKLGLNTKNFGMVQQKGSGKFVGSYSSLAEKLAKDALTDSFSSKVINEKGFAERVVALGGTRRGRVDKLVAASSGGKK